jgi:Short repeat of unknown function (DUF308)
MASTTFNSVPDFQSHPAAQTLVLAYGVLMIIAPLIGAIVLTWWIGAYALAFGIALVIFSLKLRSRQHELASPTPVRRTA